jgi:3-deoxy-D-manno-octulosonate 8-phosphate phosphatase (KDO 8-P phosphatase)
MPTQDPTDVLDSRLAGLRLVVFDVDGVFTDGRFTLDANGAESKTFNTQDGYGVRRLREAGLEVAVISGRDSAAVDARMRELDVTHVYQACRDKRGTIAALADRLGVGPEQILAVGDDIPDLALFEASGLRVAVANAVSEVRAAADIVTSHPGGHGAVREIADRILSARAARAQ